MISSQRLILKPLSKKQLVEYIHNNGALERDLKLNQTKKYFSPALSTALIGSILPNMVSYGKNHLFSTLWVIILKKESKIIGDLCFVGKPDETGEIELGYNTYEDFRNKGYMTEAITCIIEWASRQDHVRSIFAQTAKNNTASNAILKKNNFKKVAEDDTLINWRLQINNFNPSPQ